MRKGLATSLYFVFRVLVGFLFLLHGGQKLFGWFGGIGELNNMMMAAGMIEFVGGLFILLGLFTSFVALITAVEIAVAYFIVHLPQGVLPIANGGEPAALFFLAFLVLIGYGAGKWSLERAILRKEVGHSKR
jgi:putative oxidoreductase